MVRQETLPAYLLETGDIFVRGGVRQIVTEVTDKAFKYKAVTTSGSVDRSCIGIQSRQKVVIITPEDLHLYPESI